MTTYAILLIIIIFGLLIWKTWSGNKDPVTEQLSYRAKAGITYLIYSAIISMLIALFWRNDLFLKLSSFLFLIPIPMLIFLNNKYDKK